MRESKKYLAVDLGASGGRGIVGSFDGERLTLRENLRFSNEPVSVGGRLYWDILRLFHEIKNSLRQTRLDGDKIESVGIDTWGVDYGLVDKYGNLLSNPIHYRDKRTNGIEKYACEIMPFERLYGITGIQSLNFNTVYQLCAELRDKPEIISQIDKILFIPDLLNYFLTGKMATEYTIASTGAILDVYKRTLSREVLGAFGIPEKYFARVTTPANRLGCLLPSIAEECGTDTEVVNVASHDTASAVIAVPAKSKDFIYISSGTWSLMGTELSTPIVNADSREANYTNEGGAEGTVRFLKNIMGLWILQESRRQWKREGREYSFTELEAMARRSKPFAAFIDPDFGSFASPGDMPARIAEYCRATGQYVPVGVGEIVRCIYESLALKYRMTASNIMKLTGISPGAINIVGGGSKDGLLNEMAASATGLSVIAGPGEATAIGNLIVQMISDGVISSVAEGRELIGASFETKTYLPRDVEAWDAAYDEFVRIISNKLLGCDANA